MDINGHLFWAKVDKTETCWNWTGAKIPKGYGYLTSKRRNYYSHRISWEWVNGPIPEGGHIDHICHNTSCVRPDHLRAVTRKENQENRCGAQANSRSGVRGVSWHKVTKRWRAVVQHRGKQIHIGYFTDLTKAEAAVIAKRNDLFTHNDLDRVA